MNVLVLRCVLLYLIVLFFIYLFLDGGKSDITFWIDKNAPIFNFYRWFLVASWIKLLVGTFEVHMFDKLFFSLKCIQFVCLKSKT